MCQPEFNQIFQQFGNRSRFGFYEEFCYFIGGCRAGCGEYCFDGLQLGCVTFWRWFAVPVFPAMQDPSLFAPVLQLRRGFGLPVATSGLCPVFLLFSLSWMIHSFADKVIVGASPCGCPAFAVATSKAGGRKAPPLHFSISRNFSSTLYMSSQQPLLQKSLHVTSAVQHTMNNHFIFLN